MHGHPSTKSATQNGQNGGYLRGHMTSQITLRN